MLYKIHLVQNPLKKRTYCKKKFAHQKIEKTLKKNIQNNEKKTKLKNHSTPFDCTLKDKNSTCDTTTNTLSQHLETCPTKTSKHCHQLNFAPHIHNPQVRDCMDHFRWGHQEEVKTESSSQIFGPILPPPSPSPLITETSEFNHLASSINAFMSSSRYQVCKNDTISANGCTSIPTHFTTIDPSTTTKFQSQFHQQQQNVQQKMAKPSFISSSTLNNNRTLFTLRNHSGIKSINNDREVEEGTNGQTYGNLIQNFRQFSDTFFRKIGNNNNNNSDRNNNNNYATNNNNYNSNNLNNDQENIESAITTHHKQRESNSSFFGQIVQPNVGSMAVTESLRTTQVIERGEESVGPEKWKRIPPTPQTSVRNIVNEKTQDPREIDMVTLEALKNAFSC